MRKADLTPEQLACVEYAGRDTLLIKGPPGSGKTWVLLFRGHALGRAPGEAVHFITFTNALARAAEDMDREAAQSEAGQPVPARLSISTFHSWCARLLRRLGIVADVVSDAQQRQILDRILAEARLREYASASRVRDNPAEWWLDEFRWIKGRLLPGGRLIRDYAEYAGVERTGRGSPLQAPARQIVWDVYQSYQSMLAAAGRVDWDDFARLAVDHYMQDSGSSNAAFIAVPDRDKVDHILVDETQDLQQVQLLLLAHSFRKTLTVVADEAQKIYRTTFSFASVSLHFDSGNVRSLDLSFRSTRQILALAHPLLPAADAASVTAHPAEGPIPVLYVCPDAEQEEAVILHLTAAIARAAQHKTVGLLARTWPELDRIQSGLLNRHGIAAEPLRKRDGSAFTPGVKLTTFHSAKGLEFDTVLLTHLNDGVLPLDPTQYHAEMSPVDYAEFLSFERKLLYVAMTRARHALAMTCSGAPSRFLQELDPTAYEIVDAQVAATAPAGQD